MIWIAFFFASATAGAVPAPTAEGQASAPYSVGTDTIATIRSKLGKPTSVQTSSDGTTVMVYLTTHAHAKGASFIPFVGMFAAGAKGSYSIKSFTFDRQGVLANFNTTDANVDCNTNLARTGCH